MKSFLTATICLIPINAVKGPLLKLMGHKISMSAKIGMSLVYSPKLNLGKGAKIGHFNFLKVNQVKLGEKSYIKHFNYLKGPFSLILEDTSGITYQNRIRRSYAPISYGEATLYLGKNSIIVSNHILDITRSIIIGDNSILAGLGTQIWTHGYYHADEGPDRVRIDGEVHIGNNVYVGSRCVFNPGVKIGNAIHIGAGSVVSKDLEKPGMYVGQALRYLDNNINSIKNRLTKLNSKEPVETIYIKE